MDDRRQPRDDRDARRSQRQPAPGVQAIEIVGGKIQDGTGEFQYLVEACDPCEADNYGYSVQGIAVSDFITPRFYDPVATSGTRYSFTGAIKVPRQILPGGYISFVNPESDEVQQILWVNPSGPPSSSPSARPRGSACRLLNGHTHDAVKKKRHVNSELMAFCKKHRSHLEKAASVRAKHYA